MAALPKNIAEYPTSLVQVAILQRTVTECESRRMALQQQRKRKALEVGDQQAGGTGALGTISGAVHPAGVQPLALSEGEMSALMAMMGNDINSLSVAKYMNAGGGGDTKLDLKERMKSLGYQRLPHHLQPAEEAVRCMWADTCKK